jgi:hypothetical protein
MYQRHSEYIPFGPGARDLPSGGSLCMTVNRRPKLSIVAPGASPEEAAAVVAALEQFMRATAPLPVAADPRPPAWQLAALHEGVGRELGLPAPWA